MRVADADEPERSFPIPILYLLDTFVTPLGGSERQLLMLLDGIDRKRFEPCIALLRPPEHPGLTFPCESRVLGYHSLASWDFFRAGRDCVSLCREKRVRILHTYFKDASRVGAIWGRAGRVPVVVGSRRNLGYANGRAEFAMLRLLSPLTTHTIANSEAAAQKAIRSEHLKATRVSVIANGLDFDLYSPIDDARRLAIRRAWGVPDGALVIGAAANLRPIKNIPFFVEAAARLSTHFPQLYFVVLGEGVDRPSLEALIERRGLKGRFFLPGFSENIPADIQGFDIAVLCSESESSPNSVIEYLATGRPTLAAKVGGIPEILNSEEVGFLYEPGDTHRFDAVLSSFIQGPELRANLSARARVRALERFSTERMVREHETLYTALLNRRSKESVR